MVDSAMDFGKGLLNKMQKDLRFSAVIQTFLY